MFYAAGGWLVHARKHWDIGPWRLDVTFSAVKGCKRPSSLIAVPKVTVHRQRSVYQLHISLYVAQVKQSPYTCQWNADETSSLFIKEGKCKFRMHCTCQVCNAGVQRARWVLTSAAAWSFVAVIRTVRVTITPGRRRNTNVAVVALITVTYAICTATRNKTYHSLLYNCLQKSQIQIIQLPKWAIGCT